MKARIVFYNTLILPLFDYCDIVWGDRGNSWSMKTLQVLHNNITRVILDLPPMFSATETLNRSSGRMRRHIRDINQSAKFKFSTSMHTHLHLHWKPLSLRRSNHRSIFMYKCINNLIEHDFQMILNQDFHSYSTRSKKNVRRPRAQRCWGQWICTFMAATDWNNIDQSTREAEKMLSFKNRLISS